MKGNLCAKWVIILALCLAGAGCDCLYVMRENADYDAYMRQIERENEAAHAAKKSQQDPPPMAATNPIASQPTSRPGL